MPNENSKATYLQYLINKSMSWRIIKLNQCRRTSMSGYGAPARSYHLLRLVAGVPNPTYSTRIRTFGVNQASVGVVITLH